MAIKIIYVHPDDMLDIRVVYDKEAPKTKAEWEYQRHAQQGEMLLTIVSHNVLHTYDAGLRIALCGMPGDVKRWKQ